MQERRDLVTALIGEHVQKYENNAMFHRAVDTLAAMLPAWVDGLAVEADKCGADLADLAEHVERMQQDLVRPVRLSEQTVGHMASQVCMIPACGCNGEPHL